MKLLSLKEKKKKRKKMKKKKKKKKMKKNRRRWKRRRRMRRKKNKSWRAETEIENNFCCGANERRGSFCVGVDASTADGRMSVVRDAD